MREIEGIHQPVILFDGVCNLCNGAVQFIIKRDRKNIFMFASLQSLFGQEVLQKFNLTSSTFNSFILLQQGKIYTKSTGALMVAKHLNGGWWWLYLFIIIPLFIRDAVYNLIAKNRYKWFGKKEACWIPNPALKSRFIDNVENKK